MDKDAIRREMRTRRVAVDQQERREVSRTICASLLASRKINLILTCWRISTYLSTSAEISTRHIINAILGIGREICVPVWNQANLSYDLSLLPPGMKLIKGQLGIREPAYPMPVPVWDVDAFIIPGLAFDMYGGRLGFGAGFYDRILAQHRNTAKLIALCYDWQVLDDQVIPQEPHDVSMQWIITEKRVIRCGQLTVPGTLKPGKGDESAQ
jgi:5-formyltetrahydrofolate cyclo-ligase